MVIKRGTKLKASPRMPVTLTRMRSGTNSRIFISNWSALMRASFMSLPLTRSAMLLSQSQWIARSPAAPDSQAVFDRFRDKVLSLLHGFAHCFAQRQMCRDCSRKDASCPVRVAPGKAFGSEAIEFFPVEKDIRGVSVQVPAFDQDVPSSGCVYGQGCLFHVVGCPYRLSGENLRFFGVRSDNERERQQEPSESGIRIRIEQRRAGLGQHDRIDDQFCESVFSYLGGHHFNDCGRLQLAGLDSIRWNIAQHRIELARDEIRRDLQNAQNTRGVLSGESRDHGHAEYAQPGECLEVGLNSCAANGIGSGDGKSGINAGHGTSPPARHSAAHSGREFVSRSPACVRVKPAVN